MYLPPEGEGHVDKPAPTTEAPPPPVQLTAKDLKGVIEMAHKNTDDVADLVDKVKAHHKKKGGDGKGKAFTSDVMSKAAEAWKKVKKLERDLKALTSSNAAKGEVLKRIEALTNQASHNGVRLVKLIKTFRSVWLLVVGFVSSVPTLCGAMGLLSLVIFASSVFLTQQLAVIDPDVVLELQNEGVDKRLLFGSVEATMWKLFGCVMGGCWESLFTPLARMDPSLGVFALLFVFAFRKIRAFYLFPFASDM